MDEEEQEDTQMKERFKEKWNRTPSKKLTEQLRTEGGKYMSILNNATKADAIVKEKYNENRRAMDILCKSEVRLGFLIYTALIAKVTLPLVVEFPNHASFVLIRDKSLYVKEVVQELWGL